MHHREWNPRPFFRYLSPPALNELCAWAEDLRPSGNGKLWERVYRGWRDLEPRARLKLEASLLPVNDLSVVEARPRLTQLAEAVWPKGNVHEEIRTWSAHDLALRLFLSAPGEFQHLHQGWVVDSLQHLHEYGGRYPARPKPSARAKADLKEALRAYLRRTAFGDRCHVEDFANEEKFALFVFIEDELAPRDRFTEGEDLEAIWERDVVRLAAIFDFETCILSVKAARREERERLRDLFAEHVIQDPLYFFDSNQSPRYALGKLVDPRFQLTPIPGTKVIGVSVQKIAARHPEGVTRRTVLDFKNASLAELRAELELRNVHPPHDVIVGVHLQFVFEGSGRARTRTVSIFNPNSSSLADTPRDRLIRKHLLTWGIDVNGRRADVGARPLALTTH